MMRGWTEALGTSLRSGDGRLGNDRSGGWSSPVDVLPVTEPVRNSGEACQIFRDSWKIVALKNPLMIVETSNKQTQYDLYDLYLQEWYVFLSSGVVGNCFWKPGNPTTH